MSRRFKHWAYLNDAGKEAYSSIFLDGIVPVLSMIPIQGYAEGREQHFYKIYLPELTNEQFEGIVDILSEKFKSSKKEVSDYFKKIDHIPLRANLTNGSGTNHPGLFI